MLYRIPRGVNDILPDQITSWQQTEANFQKLCHLYNYEEVRTPIFEQTELFVRAVGEDTDIVAKEPDPPARGHGARGPSLSGE